VHELRFHDLRHTFVLRLASSGQRVRAIQEFLGHADSQTTQIYAQYALSQRQVKLVNTAFAAPDPPKRRGGVPRAGVQDTIASMEASAEGQGEPSERGAIEVGPGRASNEQTPAVAKAAGGGQACGCA
jgi:hypothetical protein